MTDAAPMPEGNAGNLVTEAALLLIRCLQGSPKSGWSVKAEILQRLSDEGFEAALSSHKPRKRMQTAKAVADLAAEAAGTKDAQELLEAGAMAVLYLAVGREIGVELPEIIVAALAVFLDPISGGNLATSANYPRTLARALNMVSILRASVRSPEGRTPVIGGNLH